MLCKNIDFMVFGRWKHHVRYSTIAHCWWGKRKGRRVTTAARETMPPKHSTCGMEKPSWKWRKCMRLEAQRPECMLLALWQKSAVQKLHLESSYAVTYCRAGRSHPCPKPSSCSLSHPLLLYLWLEQSQFKQIAQVPLYLGSLHAPTSCLEMSLLEFRKGMKPQNTGVCINNGWPPRGSSPLPPMFLRKDVPWEVRPHLTCAYLICNLKL